MAWYIELLGAAADLEEFPRRFVAGAIHATQRDGSTFLTGSHFDQFEKPADVVQAAENFLFKSTAIVSLEWLAVKLPTIGRIQRQIGNRIDHHVLLVGLESRMKMGEVGVGGSTHNSPSDRAQAVMAAAESSPHLEAALRLWGRPNKSWPALFRITEELAAHLGKGLAKAGICSANELGRFTQSAQSHDVAGLDARHRVGYNQAPSKPMTLDEAKEFVGELLRSALRSAAVN